MERRDREVAGFQTIASDFAPGPKLPKTLISDPPLDRQSDAALIARFAEVRDERAFAELVARHGGLVLAVCRRRVGHVEDAEDAFQAVFLTLAARARALRRVRSLAGWLHNVSVRVSYRVRRGNRRWEARRIERGRSPGVPANEAVNELSAVLDEELTALASRYREVLVLCDLEGHTRQEAARRLGLSAGTVASRLSRGREALRRRLVKRGVTVGAGGLAATLARGGSAAPRVTAELGSETVQRAQRFLAARGGGELVTADKITTMAQGVLHTMFLSKISTTVCIAALDGALVLGATPASRLVGLSSPAQGAQYFEETFDDGDATDGNPVKWVVPSYLSSLSNNIMRVENGSLIVTPPNRSPNFIGYDRNWTEGDAVTDGIQLQDFSLRTQVRGLSPATGVSPYWIGISTRDTLTKDFTTGSSIWASIGSNGVLAVGYLSKPLLNSAASQFEFGRTNTGLDFVDEEINLQIDVAGNRAAVSAWRVGDEPPLSPQLRGTIPASLSTSGPITLWSFAQVSDWNKPVAFRYVSTSVPEPSTAVLGSLGLLALAAYAYRVRLGRVGALEKRF